MDETIAPTGSWFRRRVRRSGTPTWGTGSSTTSSHAPQGSRIATSCGRRSSSR
jgi:hypothetical protein